MFTTWNRKEAPDRSLHHPNHPPSSMKTSGQRPWGRCCLGLAENHRVEAATAYQRTRAAEILSNALASDHWALPVLQGESGSGKTSLMIGCATNFQEIGHRQLAEGTVVVMVYPTDIPQLEALADTFSYTIQRTYAAVFAAVAAEKMGGIGSELSTARYTTANFRLRVVIALDEAWALPKVVLNLCRSRLDIAQAVRTSLAVHAVRFVVAGGATPMIQSPGSMPPDYRIIRLAPPANLVDALHRDLQGVPQRIFDAVVKDEIIGAPFVTNPRCAEMVALVAKRLMLPGAASVSQPIPRSVKGMVPAVLAMAAASFKAVSGCSGFTAKEMDECMSEALRYCAHPDLCATAEIPACLGLAGLITDYSVVQSHFEHGHVEYAEERPPYHVITRIGEGAALTVAKGRSRYRMTAAQVALCSLGYGGAPVVASVRGAVDAAALFCEMRLRAMKGGASLGALVSLFHPTAHVASALASASTAYTGVRILRLGNHSLITAELDRAAELIAQGDAVVIVNGPHQPSCLADVVVVTKGLVVLTTCKYYGARRWTVENFAEALQAMGWSCQRNDEEVARKGKTTRRETPRAAAPLNGPDVMSLSQLIAIAAPPETTSSAAYADNVVVVFEIMTTIPPLDVAADCKLPRPATPHCFVQQWNTTSLGSHQSLPDVLPVTFPQLDRQGASSTDDECDVAPADQIAASQTAVATSGSPGATTNSVGHRKRARAT